MQHHRRAWRCIRPPIPKCMAKGALLCQCVLQRRVRSVVIYTCERMIVPHLQTGSCAAACTSRCNGEKREQYSAWCETKKRLRHAGRVPCKYKGPCWFMLTRPENSGDSDQLGSWRPAARTCRRQTGPSAQREREWPKPNATIPHVFFLRFSYQRAAPGCKREGRQSKIAWVGESTIKKLQVRSTHSRCTHVVRQRLCRKRGAGSTTVRWHHPGTTQLSPFPCVEPCLRSLACAPVLWPFAYITSIYYIPSGIPRKAQC